MPNAHVVPAAVARKRLSNPLPNVLAPTSYPVPAMTKPIGVKWTAGSGKKTNLNQSLPCPSEPMKLMMPMMRMPLKTYRLGNQQKAAKSHQRPVPGAGGDVVAAAGDATVAAVKKHQPRKLTTPPTPTHPTPTKMTSARFSSKRIMRT